MNAKQNMKSVSTIEQDLASVNMPDHVRNTALHGAHLAEAIVDALLWISGRLERPDTGVFAKPSPKY